MYFTVNTLQANCYMLKKIVLSHCLQSSRDVKLCTHILIEMMIRLFTSKWRFSTWLDGRSWGSWVSAEGGKTVIFPSGNWDEEPKILENLKSEA